MMKCQNLHQFTILVQWACETGYWTHEFFKLLEGWRVEYIALLTGDLT